MQNILLNNFRGQGSKLVNAKINISGAIEKLKPMVIVGQLPSETKGLYTASGQIYTFGTAETVEFNAELPSNLNYKRLILDDDSISLIQILSVGIFSDVMYVVGGFSDGIIRHFYDGVSSGEWDFNDSTPASTEDSTITGEENPISVVQGARAVATVTPPPFRVTGTARGPRGSVTITRSIRNYYTGDVLAVRSGNTFTAIDEGSAPNGKLATITSTTHFRYLYYTGGRGETAMRSGSTTTTNSSAFSGGVDAPAPIIPNTTQIYGFLPELFVDSRQMMVRDGDNLWMYGGFDGQTYNTNPVEVELPFLNGGDNGTNKQWESIDIKAQGEWELSFVTDINNPTNKTAPISISNSILEEVNIPISINSTGLAPHLRCVSNGAALIESVGLNYT